MESYNSAPTRPCRRMKPYEVLKMSYSLYISIKLKLKK